MLLLFCFSQRPYSKPGRAVVTILTWVDEFMCYHLPWNTL